jgi:hypothetical protein
MTQDTEPMIDVLELMELYKQKCEEVELLTLDNQYLQLRLKNELEKNKRSIRPPLR